MISEDIFGMQSFKFLFKTKIFYCHILTWYLVGILQALTYHFELKEITIEYSLGKGKY